MGTGDAVELRNGRGRGWKGVIVGGEKASVRVQVNQREPLRNESPLKLTLAMAMARSDRMDQVVRQATELGVHRVVGYRSQRSQYGLSDAQGQKRCERWLRIAREAMCQCGRMIVPEITYVPDLTAFIATQWGAGTPGNFLRLLASEEEQNSALQDVWQSAPVCDAMLTVIGPEGGWTEEELEEFAANGFRTVHLGPRILRLETAAVAFVAMVQMFWGDLSSRG